MVSGFQGLRVFWVQGLVVSKAVQCHASQIIVCARIGVPNCLY